jgi:hypothetical protein
LPAASFADPSLTRIADPDKLFEPAGAADMTMFVLRRIERSALHWIYPSRTGQ